MIGGYRLVAGSRRWWLGVVLIVAAMLGAAAWNMRATAAGDLLFEWRIHDRFGDINGDGVVDEQLTTEYVNPTEWQLTFDACDAPAWVSSASGSTISWTFTKGSTVLSQPDASCEVTQTVDELGTWTVTATLETSDGSPVTSHTQDVTPVDRLIVSLGDSVGSGEGNPDTINHTAEGFPFYEAVWADEKCHRTSLAGTAQAALRMERRDPHSTITFLHLACSGATIEEGLLGEYEGIEPDEATGKEPPQIARAIELAAGRKIDAMYISIGANNVKFSKIVVACLVYTNCDTALTPNVLPIPPGFPVPDQNAKQIYEQYIPDLAESYEKLDDALDPLLTGNKIGEVYLTEYFDPATDDASSWCGVNRPREKRSYEWPTIAVTDGISASEWQWASQTVVAGINGAVQTAVEASDDDGGAKWNFVSGIASSFRGHGYCAVDRWVRTLAESFSYQGNKEGSFHPNTEGHLLGYAKQIELASATDLGIGGTPLPFERDPAAAFAASGLSDFIGALDRLDAGSVLLGALPFHGDDAIQTGMDHVFGTLGWVQTKVDAILADASAGITEVDEQLDDINNDGDLTSDADIPGLIVDLEGEIGPHLPALKYDVVLHLKVTVDESNPTMEFLADSMRLNGAALDGKTLIDTTVKFVLEPKLPDTSKRFRIPDGGVDLGSLGFGFEADLGGVDPTVGGDIAPLGFTAGVAGVHATGPIQADIAAAFKFIDPNNDGVIDATEMNDPTALFDVRCVSDGAHLDLTVKSDLAGLEQALGRMTLDDPDLCDGVSTPTIQLAELQGLREITPADIINGIARLSTLVSALQENGDIDLPFVDGALRDLVKLNERIVQFFVDNNLTDPANPMASINIPQTQAEALDTIEEILPELAEALGLPPQDQLGIRWVDGRLLFDVGVTADPVPLENAASLDFEDQLASAGLTGVVATSGTAGVTLDPQYALDMTFGIDLRDGLAFDDRFFIQAGDGPEFWIDAPITADVNLSGTAAIIDVTLVDQAAGAVPLLSRRDPTFPMLVANIDGRGDDRLTLAEAAEAVGLADIPIDVIFNAKVPQTTLTATATVGGQDVATGTITFEWPDVTVFSGENGLLITADAEFKEWVLPLSFDLSDPTAAIGEVLASVRAVIVSLRELLATNPTLVERLPLIGESAADVDPVLADLTETLDTLIQVNDSLTLDAAEEAAEAAIGEALGIANTKWGDLLTFTLEKADPVQSRQAAIVVALDLSACTADRSPEQGECTAQLPQQTYPFNLELGGEAIGGIAGLDTTGQATASFDTGVHFVAGLELPTVTINPDVSAYPQASGSIAPFIRDDSRFELGVGLSATTTLSAALGPVEVSLGNADVADPIVAGLAARYRIGKAVPTNSRVYIDGAAFDSFLDSLVPTAATGIHDPEYSPTCGGTAVDACAKLPVYLEGSKLGNIEFRAPNLLDPATWTFTGVDEVLANIDPTELAFQLLIEGLDYLAARLEEALANVPSDQPVPLLGTDVGSVVDVIGKFRTGVLTPIQTLTDDLEAATSTVNLANQTRSFFVSNIGPGTSVPILRDFNADGTIDGNDVVVKLWCEGTSSEVPCDMAGTGESVANVVRYEVLLPLGVTGEASAPPFDLGFPGLRMASTAQASMSAGFELDVRFGIDRQLGFYIPTERDPADPTTGEGPELELFVDGSLPNAADAPDIEGDLVFLPISVEDTHAGPDVEASVGVDLIGGDASGWITLQKLDGIRLDPSLSVCANLDLDVELSTPSVNGETAPSSMPRVLTNLEVRGGYECNGSIGVGVQEPMSITFRDVSIDPGPLFDEFIRPIVKEVRRYTGPIEPVIDAIQQPIPGVAEAADAAGQPKPVWYDLLRITNELNMAQGNPDGLVMVDRAIQLVNLVRAFDETDAFTGDPAPILIGTFTVPLGEVTEPVPANRVANLVQGAPTDATPILERISGLAGSIDQRLDEATGAQGGLSFPVLEEPTLVFQLLVGKDVPLVYYDAGLLKVSRSMRFEYPIGPFVLYVGGMASVQGHFAAGYDTYGLRQAIAYASDDNPDNDGFFSITGGLLQGFYIDDLDSKGIDVPEIRFDAELTAGVAIGVPGLSAGAEGGVHGRIDLNIKDNDGKLRFEEMGAQIVRNPNPLCFFTVSLRLDAFIRVVVNYPEGQEQWPIADTVIFEEPDLAVCDEPVEPLAILHGDGTLELKTTSLPDTVSVHFTSPGTALVSTPDVEAQEYAGVARLFGSAGGGRDQVVVTAEPSVTSGPIVLCGGGGADILSASAGPASLYGDGGGSMMINGGLVECAAVTSGGKDTLTGGVHNDVLDGGGNNDALHAGDGADTLLGGDGDDVLQPGTGDDTVDGGDGKDALNYADRIAGVTASLPGPSGQTGTSESDVATNVETLTGGNGDDHLTGLADAPTFIDGGKGHDQLFGGAVNDILFGGEGNDVLSGGDGTNQLMGGDGDDTFVVGIGGDTMIGQRGVDSVDYSGLAGPVRLRVDGLHNDGQKGDAADNIVDVDRITGTTESDQMIGGVLDEELIALAGDDKIDGGAGNDVLKGGDGNDGIEGGAGDDRLQGGNGHDALSGGAGNDLLYGGTGDDRLRGGDGDDELQGGAHADLLIGDAGGDIHDGGAGKDTVDYSARTTRVVVTVNKPGCDGNPIIDAGGGSGCGGDDVRSNVEVIKGGAAGDFIEGDASGEEIYGGGGGDTLIGGGGPDRLDGGDGDDYLFDRTVNRLGSDSDSDVFIGGAGNDSIVGQGGNDSVDAGAGNDIVETGRGTDTVAGGDGDDTIRTGNAPDTVDGGAGNDVIDGGSGDDTLLGGTDNDTIVGGGGSDTIDGGKGDDVLYGGARPGESGAADAGDTISGGDGNDRLVGGAGEDTLLGGLGNDRLEGGSANDVLDGGAGDDVEYGEGGADVFRQGTAANGADVLRGGGGTDTADYSLRTSAVNLSKDGHANDGALGEGDNIATDVEVLSSP